MKCMYRVRPNFTFCVLDMAKLAFQTSMHNPLTYGTVRLSLLRNITRNVQSPGPELEVKYGVSKSGKMPKKYCSRAALLIFACLIGIVECTICKNVLTNNNRCWNLCPHCMSRPLNPMSKYLNGFAPCASNQGLTVAHFSAQPKLFWSGSRFVFSL